MPAGPTALVASPMASGLAVLTDDGRVLLISQRRVSAVVDLSGSLDKVTALTFGPDGKRLFIGTDRGALRVVEVPR